MMDGYNDDNDGHILYPPRGWLEHRKSWETGGENTTFNSASRNRQQANAATDCSTTATASILRAFKARTFSDDRSRYLLFMLVAVVQWPLTDSRRAQPHHTALTDSLHLAAVAVLEMLTCIAGGLSWGKLVRRKKQDASTSRG